MDRKAPGRLQQLGRPGSKKLHPDVWQDHPIDGEWKRLQCRVRGRGGEPDALGTAPEPCRRPELRQDQTSDWIWNLLSAHTAQLARRERSPWHRDLQRLCDGIVGGRL